MAPRPHPSEKERRRAEILDEVLRSHGDELRRHARYHSVRSHTADDALDDGCVAFMRHYNGPSGIAALRYLRVAVKTAAWAIDRRRRRLELQDADNVFRADLKLDPLASVPDPGDEPDLQYERSEQLRERSALLGALKPDERTALFLFAAGYSYREIAARQGWTYTKVNRCIAEGRARLKEVLAAEGERS